MLQASLVVDSKYSVDWNINCLVADSILYINSDCYTCIIIHYPTNLLCVYFQSLHRKDCNPLEKETVFLLNMLF